MCSGRYPPLMLGFDTLHMCPDFIRETSANVYVFLHPNNFIVFNQIQLCNLCNIYSQKSRDSYVINVCIYRKNNRCKLHIHVSPYILSSGRIDYIFVLFFLVPVVLNPFPIITARFIPP